MQPNGKNFKVLSFNLEYGGQNRYLKAWDYAHFIKVNNVDIACLQETSNVIEEENIHLENLAIEISRILGWNLFIQRTSDCYSNAIISHYQSTDVFYQDNIIFGVEFESQIIVINDHLIDEPYGPYVLEVTQDKNLIQEVIDQASEIRAIPFLNKVKSLLELVKSRNRAIIITGDFNEPSFLDWTENKVDNGMVPFAVEWPTSKLLYEVGFKDSFRVKYPDEVENPGMTWYTPVAAKEYQEHYKQDRLDYIYFNNLQVLDFQIQETLMSDHNPIIACFKFCNISDQDI